MVSRWKIDLVARSYNSSLISRCWVAPPGSTVSTIASTLLRRKFSFQNLPGAHLFLVGGRSPQVPQMATGLVPWCSGVLGNERLTNQLEEILVFSKDTQNWLMRRIREEAIKRDGRLWLAVRNRKRSEKNMTLSTLYCGLDPEKARHVTCVCPSLMNLRTNHLGHFYRTSEKQLEIDLANLPSFVI